MATAMTLPDHPKLPKGKTVAVVVLDRWGEASPDNDGNKSLYLVFVGVVFLSILDCF
jgi:hypothetical protein